MNKAGEGRARQARPSTHASGPHVVLDRSVVMSFRLTLAAVSVSREKAPHRQALRGA